MTHRAIQGSWPGPIEYVSRHAAFDVYDEYPGANGTAIVVPAAAIAWQVSGSSGQHAGPVDEIGDVVLDPFARDRQWVASRVVAGPKAPARDAVNTLAIRSARTTLYGWPGPIVSEEARATLMRMR